MSLLPGWAVAWGQAREDDSNPDEPKQEPELYPEMKIIWKNELNMDLPKIVDNKMSWSFTHHAK